jgi:hypothetical protein
VGLAFLAKRKPRALGIVWFPLGTFLALSAWLWERGDWFGSNALLHGGLQDEVSLVVWLASAVVAARMAWTAAVTERPRVWATRWFTRISEALRLRPLGLAQICGLVALTGIVGTGLAMELQIGRANLHFNSAANPMPPDVEAGIWLRSHTSDSAIVMARQVPTVYYYADRKVVWFPPSSNPQLLMEGIERHHVGYVVIAKRISSYYLPSDDDSFAQLHKAYPDAFHLVAQTEQVKIFQVVADSDHARKVTALSFQQNNLSMESRRSRKEDGNCAEILGRSGMNGCNGPVHATLLEQSE